LTQNPTFGDNALNADHVAEHGAVERSGCDMPAAKTALKADVKVLVALGVGGIQTAYVLLQCSLECLLLLKGVFHQAAMDKKIFRMIRSTKARFEQTDPMARLEFFWRKSLMLTIKRIFFSLTMFFTFAA
jgi:hypothetical protein